MKLSKEKQTGSNAAGDQRNASSAALQEQIEKSAYYRSEARGFAPGYELEDWLAAEAEINLSAKSN